MKHSDRRGLKLLDPTFFAVVVLLLFGSGRVEARSEAREPAPREICALAGSPMARVGSAAELLEYFARAARPLEALRGASTVATLQVDRVPPDLSKLPSERVDLFLRLVLPSAVHVNDSIDADRARLQALRGGPNSSPEDARFVAELADRYGLAEPSLPELLERVDRIPISLLLAQAADESGWGRSRFAIEGNALYGQHASGHDGPSIAARGARVRMAAFASVCDATRAYVHNLNTSDAYADLRSLRAKRRSEGNHASGPELAGGLLRYSERGEAYVRDLRSIMRHHRLEDFDRLKGTTPTGWVRVAPPADGGPSWPETHRTH